MPPGISKYRRHIARHNAALRLRWSKAECWSASTSLRYRDVPTLDRSWLADARIARVFGRWQVFASGRNLLDDEHEEIPGVPTAGRYMEVGAIWEL